jgi:hypothetical protein
MYYIVDSLGLKELKMKFEEWVFTSLCEFGAIRDYSVAAKSGKGKKPKGNLSIQIARISELRNSSNLDLRLWGMIGYAGLQSAGEFGPKMLREVSEFAEKCDPEKSARIIKAMKRAAAAAKSEFMKRYKENKPEMMDE